MKPINIYTLTRIKDPERLSRLERQLSGRSRFLKIKEWETGGLRAFTDRLCSLADDAPDFDFFYSFTMPKLGKEFDLIRVAEDSLVNIELKSGDVTDEAIKAQLVRNRYYLSTLGKSMHFYTYISNEDRLVRLSNTGKLVETDFEELTAVLHKQENCYDGHIEDLFKEDSYLISPITDPGRFLRQEYFLTSQQRDIKKSVLKTLTQHKEKGAAVPVQGFTGLPGTGKTILLYDLAMQLSRAERVCVLHFGSHAKELEQLDERLKRIDFFYCSDNMVFDIEDPYSVIFIDEGHRMDRTALDSVMALSQKWNAPVIISYDKEDSIAAEERRGYGSVLIEDIPGFIMYRLTNRIRLNSELSAFINCVMSFKGRTHRKDYPSVSVAYANTDAEAGEMLAGFMEAGYVYIKDTALLDPLMPERAGKYRGFMEVEASEATCKEFDNVVMLIDDTFEYDRGGNLRKKPDRTFEPSCGAAPETELADDFRVRRLFHGLSRAKRKIALVVKDNEPVFDVLLFILQH